MLAEARDLVVLIQQNFHLNVLGVARDPLLEGYDAVFCENFSHDFPAGDQPKHPVEYTFLRISKRLIRLYLHLLRGHPVI